MGAALNFLTAGERERIARQLLTGCKAFSDRRIEAHCPWHTETTPGGAFYYDTEKDSGICYSCQNHGDLIDIFCAVRGYADGSAEGFKAFFSEYAPERLERARQSCKPRKPAVAAAAKLPGLVLAAEHEDDETAWEPQPVISPDRVWQEKALAFVEACAAELQARPAELHRLQAKWGITAEMAAYCRIGFNGREAFRPQKVWGLPDEKNQNGRDRCIHFPVGFVFPVFRPDGAPETVTPADVQRVKIRVDTPGENEPRYKAVKGGSPNAYAVYGAHDALAFVIVETERDAAYLWQQLWPYGIGTMGVGTARLAPDAEAHALLLKAAVVLNALDNDIPGARASWRMTPSQRFSWNQTYAHCIRWPVPRSLGKDAGDLAGQDVVTAWQWISAALPMPLVRQMERRAEKALAALLPPASEVQHG